MDYETISEYIKALEHMTLFMNSLLNAENEMPPAPNSEKERLKEITYLRTLAKSDKWPEAISPELICGDNEDDKLIRSGEIVREYIHDNVAAKKFLDFGCGEGHTAFVAALLADAEISVGYDIQDSNWNHFEEVKNLVLTTDLNSVELNAPYDIILIHDVLDHANDPKSILRKVKNLKSPSGKVYLRIHPWTSRHGSHLYKQLNKAFLNIVFTKDELYSMGVADDYPTNKILNCKEYYKNMIKEVGFEILSEDEITYPLEMFFIVEPKVLRRIKQHFSEDGKTIDARFPRDILEIQFLDYVLI